jgi:CRP/FNR family cyclic AMP-dependent transcriptional regulator
MTTKTNRSYVYGSIIRTSENLSESTGKRLAPKIEQHFSRSHGRPYQKGEVIYQPGDVDDSLYYIKSGKVKLAYLDESGRKLTLTILGEGEIFGEMVLIGKGKRQLMAQVLQEAFIYELERSGFLEMLRQNPELTLEVMELFGRRTREIERKLEDLVFKDIPTRLSRQILQLIEEHGVKTGEGIQIDFKITHKELADLIGSARENTTSALNRLAKEGILDKKRYRIIVKDEARLKEKSGS